MKIKQPPVSHEWIDGEVVIINMETGTYYSLLDVAAALWQSVAAGTTREELLARAEAAYPGERDAVDAFLDELVAEGLLVDEAPLRTGAVPELPPVFSVPRVEKYTDMQELLMLDPIHEVDAAGWPHKG